jgi:hypothetical protein
MATFARVDNRLLAGGHRTEPSGDPGKRIKSDARLIAALVFERIVDTLGTTVVPPLHAVTVRALSVDARRCTFHCETNVPD